MADRCALILGLGHLLEEALHFCACLAQIDAKKSVPQEQKPKARKIFVGGLAPETTEGESRAVALARLPPRCRPHATGSNSWVMQIEVVQVLLLATAFLLLACDSSRGVFLCVQRISKSILNDMAR